MILFLEIGFNTMKDTCLIEHGTVHGDMFFFVVVFCCFVNGVKGTSITQIGFISSKVFQREMQNTKKRYKRIDYLLLTK